MRSSNSDAVMGWAVDGYEALHQAYSVQSDRPERGLSYARSIMGELTDGTGSALVAFTNTPEIVGDELHIVAAIDIKDGQIVRQVDYCVTGFTACGP